MPLFNQMKTVIVVKVIKSIINRNIRVLVLRNLLGEFFLSGIFFDNGIKCHFWAFSPFSRRLDWRLNNDINTPRCKGCGLFDSQFHVPA